MLAFLLELRHSASAMEALSAIDKNTPSFFESSFLFLPLEHNYLLEAIPDIHNDDTVPVLPYVGAPLLQPHTPPAPPTPTPRPIPEKFTILGFLMVSCVSVGWFCRSCPLLVLSHGNTFAVVFEV